MIFIDAGAIVAYYIVDDPFHEAACEGFAALNRSGEKSATTSLCIAEALSVISQKSDHARGARAGMQILEWEMEVLRPSLADEKRAVKLMETYAERRVGFVDCVSFGLMDARGIGTAFTFDVEHFVKVRKLKAWVPILRIKKR